MHQPQQRFQRPSTFRPPDRNLSRVFGIRVAARFTQGLVAACGCLALLANSCSIIVERYLPAAAHPTNGFVRSRRVMAFFCKSVLRSQHAFMFSIYRFCAIFPLCVTPSSKTFASMHGLCCNSRVCPWQMIAQWLFLCGLATEQRTWEVSHDGITPPSVSNLRRSLLCAGVASMHRASSSSGTDTPIQWRSRSPD
jgi:hypothetical protein